ncbi:Protein AIG2 C like protein [Verticillium longisporum]|uniref:Putative gamma-glutamylcyclotransferase n=1 Tax=Verticillium longisporum TaxID=100787 RepID=A0A8I3AGT7_VERLO|nr:Protein AIG2 C like protein [Verticillium longisporum]
MSGPHTAFFYGTLMEPRVFFRVVQGTSHPSDVIKSLYTFTPAVLHDHCRHRVQGEDYPGVIPEEGQSVLGSFVTGLTDANIQKLDSFEGSEYDRRAVKVKLVTKLGNAQGVCQVEGEEEETTTYIFIHPNRIERGEWDFEHFRKEKLHMWAREEIFFSEGKLEPPHC